MRQISESAAALVKRIFERNADAQAAYVTSDDQVFRNENDALGQANNLKRAGKSAEITTITRAESEEQGAEGKPSIGAAVAKVLLDAAKSGSLVQVNPNLPGTESGKGDGGERGAESGDQGAEGKSGERGAESGKGTEGKEPGKPELTGKEKAAKVLELATAKRADAQAGYDAAVANKGSLPEGAHANTVRAADKRIEKALAELATAESELEAAEAAVAELDGE